jgi:hypothetical protein
MTKDTTIRIMPSWTAWASPLPTGAKARTIPAEIIPPTTAQNNEEGSSRRGAKRDAEKNLLN